MKRRRVKRRRRRTKMQFQWGIPGGGPTDLLVITIMATVWASRTKRAGRFCLACTLV